MEKGLTYFTAALRTNGIVLDRLLRLRKSGNQQHLIPMFEEDEDILDDAIIENRQALEMVQMYSDILSGMMDAFTSVISNNLNQVMKFLASISGISRAARDRSRHSIPPAMCCTARH